MPKTPSKKKGEGGEPQTWRSHARESALPAPKADLDPLDMEDEADALTMSAMQGNAEAVAALMARGVSANAKDSIGVAPLHWGAFCGHAAVVGALIDAGADVQCRDQEGRTPLHVAAYESHADVLKRLLKAGSEVAAPDKMGWTALHCAVSNNQEATCKLLTEAGADPLVKDSEGKTPMDLAKHFGNDNMIRMLEGAQDHAEVLDLKSLGIGERSMTSSQRSARGTDTNQRSPTSVTQSPQVS